MNLSDSQTYQSRNQLVDQILHYEQSHPAHASHPTSSHPSVPHIAPTFQTWTVDDYVVAQAFFAGYCGAYDYQSEAQCAQQWYPTYQPWLAVPNVHKLKHLVEPLNLIQIK